MDKLAYEANFNLLLDSGLHQQLRYINHGIEKESLRVTEQGLLSQEVHPKCLGNKLTHPQITTDFSEAQLEFITPVSTHINQTLAVLNDIHRYTYSILPNSERLWVASMPCILPGDNNIPLAQYGDSHAGQLKTLYRNGLGCRYGRLMQTICGIHYNFSLPGEFWRAYKQLSGESSQSTSDFRTDCYLAMIRNFQRFSWLLLYLFGASPAVCKSFLRGREHNLTEIDDGSLYHPYATSLRMGGIGYQSDAQKPLKILFNELADYTQSIIDATHTNYPPYQELGLKNIDGEYQQINTSLLQTEAEYYGFIRPKPLKTQDLTLNALNKNGIEYVEVRCVDLNPFIHTGIDENTAAFIDSFLLFCLFYPSPTMTEREHDQIVANTNSVVTEGRSPTLTINDNDQQRSILDWGSSLINKITKVAKVLDELHSTNIYSRSIEEQMAKLENPELTPSAQILATMKNENIPYFRFAMNQTLDHEKYFRQDPLTGAELELFQQLAKQSIEDFNNMSTDTQQSFEEFLLDSLYR